MSDEKPKINNYLNDIHKNAYKSDPETDESPDVDPYGAKPPRTEQPHHKSIAEVKSGTTKPPKPTKPSKPKKSKKSYKKLWLTLAITALTLAVAYLIAAFIMVIYADPFGLNPIAGLLGFTQIDFVNFLITGIHVIFILGALGLLTFTMLGFFKVLMTKKEDKEKKKSGMKQGIIFSVILAVYLIIWLSVFIYLSGKRIDPDDLLPPISTDPEYTLELTAPITIKFDASNVPIDRTQYRIITSNWNFGDGNDGTGTIVTHTFEKKGRYDVVLTVTKRDVRTNEETEDIYSVIVAIENQELTASFTASPLSGAAPLEVEFDASESVDPDGVIDRYEWDFDGDGQFDDAEGVEAVNVFEEEGRYTVALRVVSLTNEFNVSEKEIVVTEDDLSQVQIEVVNEPEEDEFLVDQSYIFQASEPLNSDVSIVRYDWEFGDGSTNGRTKTVSHTFTQTGTFQVVLTVTDSEDNESEIRKTVTVRNPQGTPQAEIVTTNGQTSGSIPLTLTFDAGQSTDSDNNIVDYEWNFGDGSTKGFGKVIEHTFTDEGTYQVSLIVTDADGNEGLGTLVVNALEQGIQADLKANRIDGSVPLTVSFDASGSTFDNGQITSYRWNFGNGTPERLGNSQISHRYTEIGTYTATVTVIGSDNSQDTAEILITVREIPLEACFQSVFSSGAAPLITSFDPSCSTGAASNYFWDFDDDSTSNDVKPNHTFQNPGTYNVTLEISDSDNTVDTFTKTITVTE